jgi:hypothetical protein
VLGCVCVCSTHQKRWDNSSRVCNALFKKDIFGYTTDNEKGHNVSILSDFFQIYLFLIYTYKYTDKAMSDNQQQTTAVSDVHVEVKENQTQGK